MKTLCVCHYWFKKVLVCCGLGPRLTLQYHMPWVKKVAGRLGMLVQPDDFPVQRGNKQQCRGRARSPKRQGKSS